MNLLYLPYRLFDNAITCMGKEHLKTKILGTIVILVAYNRLIIFTIIEFHYEFDYHKNVEVDTRLMKLS